MSDPTNQETRRVVIIAAESTSPFDAYNKLDIKVQELATGGWEITHVEFAQPLTSSYHGTTILGAAVTLVRT